MCVWGSVCGWEWISVRSHCTFLFLPFCSLRSPSLCLVVTLTPLNPAIVCPLQVFTAFVSLTTADPEWEPIVCERPLSCEGPGTCTPTTLEAVWMRVWGESQDKRGNFWPSEKLCGSVSCVLFRARNHHLHEMQKCKQATSSSRKTSPN